MAKTCQNDVILLNRQLMVICPVHPRESATRAAQRGDLSRSQCCGPGDLVTVGDLETMVA